MRYFFSEVKLILNMKHATCGMRCGAELGGGSSSASPCFAYVDTGRCWTLGAPGAASRRSRERRRLKLAFLLARHRRMYMYTHHPSCCAARILLDVLARALRWLLPLRNADRQPPPTARAYRQPQPPSHVRTSMSSCQRPAIEHCRAQTRAHTRPCKAQNYCIRLLDHARRWTGECGRAREPAAVARVGSAA